MENSIFLHALMRKPTAYTPVWLMRQAGRYLPEYCMLRQRAGSFLALCKSPELATEAALQPLARFPLDAAILFSDILVVPDAMGLGLHFVEGEGPRFTHPLDNERDIFHLAVPHMEKLDYVFDTVSSIRRALADRIPLIGFSGSPFTLACYMIEGGKSNTFSRVKTMLYARPDLLKHILNINTRAVIDYLNAQIAAGAQAIQIFDTWGGILASGKYQDFSLQFIQAVISGLIREKDGEPIPVIVFTKGGNLWLEDIAHSGCDAIGLDWTIDLREARQRIGDRVALQGNLDPSVLLATPEVIEQETKTLLTHFGAGQGHIFNLGHGISQWTPPDHVAALIHAVHTYSTKPPP